MDLPVTLLASDPALRSALGFLLTLEGFDIRGDADRSVAPIGRDLALLEMFAGIG